MIYWVSADTPPTPRRMRLRYAGTCRLCRKPVPAREWAFYFADVRQIECLDCAPARIRTAFANER